MLVAGAFKPRYRFGGASVAERRVLFHRSIASVGDRMTGGGVHGKRRSATGASETEVRGLKAPATGMASLRDWIRRVTSFKYYGFIQTALF